MATPNDATSITVKDLAEALKTDPRSLRAFLRSNKLGAGRGNRYGWTSMEDPAVKRIVSDWNASLMAAQAPESSDEKSTGTKTGEAKPSSTRKRH